MRILTAPLVKKNMSFIAFIIVLTLDVTVVWLGLKRLFVSTHGIKMQFIVDLNSSNWLLNDYLLVLVPKKS